MVTWSHSKMSLRNSTAIDDCANLEITNTKRRLANGNASASTPIHSALKQSSTRSVLVDLNPPSQSFGLNPYMAKTIVAKGPAANRCSWNRRRKDRVKTKSFYVKRREASLCTYGNCTELPQEGRSQCPMHLQRMRSSERERRNGRIAKGLCSRCGELPKFWGLNCVLCRQMVAADPLPAGARKALRLYRIEQAKQLQRSIEDDTRAAVNDLLSKGTVCGKYAEALRLYVGLDTHEWRTYEQVGKIMRLTKERVRQLLLPSKIILSVQLSGRVPWPTKPSKSWSEVAISSADRTPRS